jgi:hypothetical protein
MSAHSDQTPRETSPAPRSPTPYAASISLISAPRTASHVPPVPIEKVAQTNNDEEVERLREELKRKDEQNHDLRN